MKREKAYVIARGRSGRPTCQHRLRTSVRAGCGQDMRGWSRSYQADPIESVLCRKKGCRS